MYYDEQFTVSVKKHFLLINSSKETQLGQINVDSKYIIQKSINVLHGSTVVVLRNSFSTLLKLADLT